MTEWMEKIEGEALYSCKEVRARLRLEFLVWCLYKLVKMAAPGSQFFCPLGMWGHVNWRHQFTADYKGRDGMNGKNWGRSPLLLSGLVFIQTCKCGFLWRPIFWPFGMGGHQFSADYKGYDRMNGKNWGEAINLLLCCTMEGRVHLKFEFLVYYYRN